MVEGIGGFWAGVGAVARATVACALVLSAIWKLRNARSFSIAFRESAPAFLRGFNQIARRAISAIELLLAAGLLSPLAETARPSAIAALVLITSFMVALRKNRDPTAGCGCWRAVPGVDSRKPVFARNIILLAAAALAAIRPLPAGMGLMLFALVPGLALSFAIFEIPTFAAVLSGVLSADARAEGVREA